MLPHGAISPAQRELDSLGVSLAAPSAPRAAPETRLFCAGFFGGAGAWSGSVRAPVVGAVSTSTRASAGGLGMSEARGDAAGDFVEG